MHPAAIRNVMLPRNGSSNHRIITSVRMMMSMNATIAKGMVLPRMNSPGLIGETMICSIVPDSRSRTMDIDVSMTVVSPIRRPMMAGRK